MINKENDLSLQGKSIMLNGNVYETSVYRLGAYDLSFFVSS